MGIYKSNNILKSSMPKVLGCLKNETMSGEAMALNIINKINNKLKFLHHKNSFFGTSTETPALYCVNTGSF